MRRTLPPLNALNTILYIFPLCCKYSTVYVRVRFSVADMYANPRPAPTFTDFDGKVGVSLWLFFAAARGFNGVVKTPYYFANVCFIVDIF